MTNAHLRDLENTVAALSDRISSMEMAEHANRHLQTSIDSGDTAWMLVSCALVLMMTIPGLALFYGGLAERAGNRDAVLHHHLLDHRSVASFWLFFGIFSGGECHESEHTGVW
jgi:Amt family ammonium transporter